MQEVIWGYDPYSLLPSPKIVGEDITTIKQIFSAIIFKKGVMGLVVSLEQNTGNPTINIQVKIDEELKFRTSLQAPLEKEYVLDFKQVYYPKAKLEIILEVKNGTVKLQTSAIGNGMGFIKKENKFIPSTHFPVGFVIKT